MKNLFEIRRKMYGTSRFGEKLKKKFGYENWEKLKINVWRLTTLQKIRETRGKLEKIYSSKTKIENQKTMYGTAKTEEDSRDLRMT